MDTKRYYAKVPGAGYIFTDGVKAIFAHGFLDVNEKTFPGEYVFPNPQLDPKGAKNTGRPAWQVYREELDALVEKGNPLIFTQETIGRSEPIPSFAADAAKAAKSEAEIAASDAALRNSGVQVVASGDVNNGVTGSTDPNKSTVDPQIQAALLNSRADREVIGPGAGKQSGAAEAARARALAAQASSATGKVG